MNPVHIDLCGAGCSRRRFLLRTSGALLTAVWPYGVWASRRRPELAELAGPGRRYHASVQAAFVRRRGEYGMRWPGAVYDGAAARARYTTLLNEAAAKLDLTVTLRPEPIYSPAEADAWLAQARAQRPDGLLVLLLDRQEHAWPTAEKAIATQIPTVVFSPLGTSFTTNTARPSTQRGGFICSGDDFGQVVFGLKMIRTGAFLREMRYLVIQGSQRRDDAVPHFGTRLRYLPAATFLEEYERTSPDAEIKAMAREYLRQARRVRGTTPDDVVNGVRSYAVARRLMVREEADGITMDCLGALGQTRVSLPCIAWSRLLDHGIPAACEADLGAAITHALVRHLLNRPGFQQDPVAETARQCLIGAHCSCPTRLRGFDQPAAAFDLTYHHGKRDAVPRTIWKPGERVTVVDVLLSAERGNAAAAARPSPGMVISTGTVVDNVAVPPAGGCVVSVMVKLDTESDLLAYPGFHQLFVCGDFKRELKAYCHLYGLEPLFA